MWKVEGCERKKNKKFIRKSYASKLIKYGKFLNCLWGAQDFSGALSNIKHPPSYGPASRLDTYTTAPIIDIASK